VTRDELQSKTGVRCAAFAVAAANPLATEAGAPRCCAWAARAVDAAVAVQMVLTLVEPQSSGIGGGAFLLHWDGRQLQAWDGRETAPAAADERICSCARRQADGVSQRMSWAAARSVCPGAVRMLEGPPQHGRLPWAQLFEPAIRLAEQGFRLSPRLHEALATTDPALRQDPQAAAYFYQRRWQPWPVGHLLRNPALAAGAAPDRAGGQREALHRARWLPTSCACARPCREPRPPERPTWRLPSQDARADLHRLEAQAASAACRRRRRATWR
jgi:gamma-glutamyltranspeptidase/glutathione hydrolase